MIAAQSESDSVRKISVLSKLRRFLSRRRKGKRGGGGGGRASLSVNPVNNTSQVTLHTIFSYFDVNGDGKITPEELRTCVKTVGGEQLTEEEAKVVVKSLDLDGDGVLGYDEFEQLMEGMRGEEERDRELKAAFRIFETEEGGGITASGLKRMLRRLGEVWSMEECRGMIREFDLDGNGVISFDEFVAMMR